MAARTLSLTLAMVLCLAAAGVIAAEPVTIEDVFGEFDESVLTNLDWSALASLTGLDAARLATICRELQGRLQGESVADLAPLREPAQALVPLLEQYEETQPYAAWLRTRLDYLVIAEEIRFGIPRPRLELAPPAPVPPVLGFGPLVVGRSLPGGTRVGAWPRALSLNPAPDLERNAWQDRLEQRLAPPRAQGYVARLKPIFVAAGVPAELVWLAEVESGFDPAARSPVGAAGLFQLMPETARGLGLRTAVWDERLDPAKSARAAARYLGELQAKFNDWRLTVAAYNAGEGRVRRLLEKHRTRRYDEVAVFLPAETQMYVPKVEATILRREGVLLEDLKMAKRP